MELMERWFQMIAEGGKWRVKPLYTYTVTDDWANDTDGKIGPIYDRVLAPHLTFNDGTKLCVMIFDGNATGSYYLSSAFLSMAAAPSASVSTSNAGGLIRNGWTNPRSLNTATSAWVARGTVIKVYVIDFLHDLT